MRKSLLTLLALMLAFLFVSAQTSIKLPYSKSKELNNGKSEKGSFTNGKHDRVNLEMYFMELDQETLYDIKTNSPDTKTEQNDLYNRNRVAESNYIISWVLAFNETGSFAKYNGYLQALKIN